MRALLLLGLPALSGDPEVVEDLHESRQVIRRGMAVSLQEPLETSLDIRLIEEIEALGHPGQEGVKGTSVVVFVRERVMGIDLPAVRIEADTEEEQHLIPPVFEAPVRQIEEVSHDPV